MNYKVTIVLVAIALIVISVIGLIIAFIKFNKVTELHQSNATEAVLALGICYDMDIDECKALQFEVIKEKAFLKNFTKDALKLEAEYDKKFGDVDPQIALAMMIDDDHFQQEFIKSLDDVSHALAIFVKTMRLYYPELICKHNVSDKMAQRLVILGIRFNQSLVKSLTIMVNDDMNINFALRNNHDKIRNAYKYLTSARQQAEMFVNESQGDLKITVEHLARVIKVNENKLGELLAMG